jgi:hypothetical protein
MIVDGTRELGAHAERYSFEDLGGCLGRACCRTCGESFHVVHSPMTKMGEQNLTEHAATHDAGGAS